MPSLETIERFKQTVQSLAKEQEIRQAMGLPPEEITPPESQITGDLADLLGGMPSPEQESGGQDLDSLLAQNFPESPEEPAEDSESNFDTQEIASQSDPFMDDLFQQADQDAQGLPNLDDLLGPGPTESPLEADLETSEPDFSADPFAADLETENQEAPTDPFEVEADAELEPPSDVDWDSSPILDEPLPDLGAEDIEALEEDLDFAEPVAAASSRGVNPEEMNDDFFNNPGEELYQFGETQAGGDDDDFVFDDGNSESDFPELAGFASTKEEDVEAFDETGEADEFQLGDFESQFGITADDHVDADDLNPAQSVDEEIEAAQRTLSLSEEEFAALQTTLFQQPLNLKLAIEELIGEKEVVFEDLNKIVRLLVSGTGTKTLAVAVGKVLGRKITIPPGFEKGSGEELEGQRASLWYNLRNIMFPIFQTSVVVTIVLGLLVLAGWSFLYKPWKANDLYDKGLVQIKENNGQEADNLFAQAYYYWPTEDRFFQYAEAYTDMGDYDRARRKYLELLKPTILTNDDESKNKLQEEFGKKLAPIPDGLNSEQLQKALDEKKRTLDDYFDLVVLLLSKDAEHPLDNVSAIDGTVVFSNPNSKGILDLSTFETYYGSDGQDFEAHFRRADTVLKPLFAADPAHKEALLRKGDNDLEWADKASSRARYNEANSAYSFYMQRYGQDAAVTWRFVRLFLLTDNEKEILNLRKRIETDTHLPINAEVTAQLAQWLLDKDATRVELDRQKKPRLKTLEEEYGIRSIQSNETSGNAEVSPTGGKTQLEHNLSREASGGESKDKPIEIKPPYKYPYSSQPFRADYLERLDQLLLRAIDAQKELPELHYQLSRYYRRFKNDAEEQKALGAAEAYFQRMEPRKIRLNGRALIRIDTFNRIGEIFVTQNRPLQAEQYFIESQRFLEASLTKNEVRLSPKTAVIYKNLGDLYFAQAPGAQESKNLGSWEQALKLYKKAEDGHVVDPEMTYKMGVIYFEAQDFSHSIEEFFALEKDVDLRFQDNLLYSMGNALFRNGNYTAAEGYYRQLLAQLLEKRGRITEWDPAVRASHKALALKLVQTHNNLAASMYRSTTTYRAGNRELKEALNHLTAARALAIILGKDLFENQAELDVTRVDDNKFKEIRADEARVIAMTRKEKGLVEANLQVLGMIETSTPARQAGLLKELEIFSRVPFTLFQSAAP